MNKAIRTILLSLFSLFFLIGGNVALAQEPPQWPNISNRSIFRGQRMNLKIEAFDSDGDKLTYKAEVLPKGASYSNNTLRWSPNFNTPYGSYNVVLTASDGVFSPQQLSFQVIVNDTEGQYINYNNDYYRFDDPNRAPEFSTRNTEYIALAGFPIDFRVHASDKDGDRLTYTANNLPDGANFDAKDREFTWVPQFWQVGTHKINFGAKDEFNNTGSLQIIITVTNNQEDLRNPTGSQVQSEQTRNLNRPPAFTTSPSTVIDQGSTYIYPASAFDAEKDFLTYNLDSGPIGAFMNQRTGIVTWNPSTSQYGSSHKFIVSVSDSFNNPVTQRFMVLARGSISAPVGSQPQVRVEEKTTEPIVRSEVKTKQVETTINKPTTVVIDPPLQAFGVKMHNENEETLVTWSTTKAAQVEIVFGFDSIPDKDSIREYNFTTGLIEPTDGLNHEVNLGSLHPNKTYYLRLISRNSGEVDITPELIFVSSPVGTGEIEIQEVAGTASLFDSVGGAMFTIGWIIVILLIVIVALLLYLINKTKGKGLLPELNIPQNHA